jgi:uncharacterized protein (DUF1697 family)
MKQAAMLRGINLGKRQLAKGDLIAAAQSLGFTNAQTLLASGNLVFEASDMPAPEIESALRKAVLDRTGIDSEVFVRDRAALDAAIAANPFPDAAADRPSWLLVTFHREAVPQDEVARIARDYDGPERVAAIGRELFADYPEGMGRSLLDRWTAKAKIKLPLGTGRNWNTVTKLAAMLAD